MVCSSTVFMAEKHFILCLDCNLFIHHLVNIHLLAPVKNAAERGFEQAADFFVGFIYPGVEMLGHMVIFFTF